MSPEAVDQMMMQQQQQQHAYSAHTHTHMQQQQQLLLLQKQAHLQPSSPHQHQHQTQLVHPPLAPPATSLTSFLSLPDADEIRLVLIVVAAAVALALLPVSEFAARFVAIDRIPYGDALLRAVLLGAAVFVGRRALELLA